MARTSTPPAPKAADKSAASTKQATETTAAQVVADKREVLVANNHVGTIVLPRSSMQGGQRIALPPIILHPGYTTPIPTDEWESRKKMVVIQHYLDSGLLSVVNSINAATGSINSTSDLSAAIPENLKTAEEIGATGASANVRKESVGSVTIG